MTNHPVAECETPGPSMVTPSQQVTDAVSDVVEDKNGGFLPTDVDADAGYCLDYDGDGTAAADDLCPVYLVTDSGEGETDLNENGLGDICETLPVSAP